MPGTYETINLGTQFSWELRIALSSGSRLQDWWICSLFTQTV